MEMRGVFDAYVLKYFNSLALGNRISKEFRKRTEPTVIMEVYKEKGTKRCSLETGAKLEFSQLRKAVEFIRNRRS